MTGHEGYDVPDWLEAAARRPHAPEGYVERPAWPPPTRVPAPSRRPRPRLIRPRVRPAASIDGLDLGPAFRANPMRTRRLVKDLKWAQRQQLKRRR